MICEKCGSTQIIWQSDFTCEDVYQCECDEGLVSFWICADCDQGYKMITDCINMEDIINYEDIQIEEGGEDLWLILN